MTYDEFKRAWSHALRDSQLEVLSMHDGTETLDLRSMDRVFESSVRPRGEQEAEPFHVAATLSWRWRSILTARSATTEEDMLSDVLGREDADEANTERPWLRLDVTLRASLPFGKAISMPAPAIWAKWAREVHGRLERIEPLIPEENTREGRNGRPEVLAWQGEPIAQVSCGPGGELKVESVELAAWQAIELARQWDDPDREPDEHPGNQLLAVFERVRASLHAWMQAVDHLLPREGR